MFPPCLWIFLLCRDRTLPRNNGRTWPYGGSPLIGRMFSPCGTVSAGTECRRAAARHIGNGNVEIHASGTSLRIVRSHAVTAGNFFAFLPDLFGARNPRKLRINCGTVFMCGHGNAVPSFGCLLCRAGNCTARRYCRTRSGGPR